MCGPSEPAAPSCTIPEPLYRHQGLKRFTPLASRENGGSQLAPAADGAVCARTEAVARGGGARCGVATAADAGAPSTGVAGAGSEGDGAMALGAEAAVVGTGAEKG